MAVAVVAVVLAAGGLAAAAIPDSSGVIHACYAKSDGALRVVKGSKCATGERRLSWNQGIGRVTVRSASVRVSYQSCTPVYAPSPGTPPFTCFGATKTAVAHCGKNERATGGGYGKARDGAWPSATESKPFHTFGTPTGWTVSASATVGSQSNTHADSNIPIYAVCAAP